MDQDESPDPEGPGGGERTDGPTVCSRCGKVAEGVPLTWTFSVEDGARRHVCEECARTNIRSIEGRLDTSWW
ncbi:MULTISPECIES: hypothetical protein [unclassified Streptomyces]|uniref:hypothetical protein n=1 Tax=unclassified Streptomyces TaxID=2593676 RepID=UPI0033F281D0